MTTSDQDFQLNRRELFIRTSGLITLGAALSTTSSHAETPQTSSEAPTFTKSPDIPLPIAISNPATLAIAPDRHLWIAAENALHNLTPDGALKTTIPLDDTPNALLPLQSGAILIAFRNRLITHTPGQPIQEWARLDEKAWITSLAADETYLYAADAGNRLIHRFTPDGQHINRIGEPDPQRGIPGFIIPSPYFSIAIDPFGALWAANPGKHGLESYRPGGDLITAWYRSGPDLDAFCGCCNPSYIAFLEDASLVTIEKGINRVKVIGPDQRPRALLLGPRSALDAKDALTCTGKPPYTGIAIAPGNRIHILDAPGQCIHIFQPAPLA